MRHLILAATAVLLAMPVAHAATADWLDGLFGTPAKAAHRHVVKPKPDAPATATEAPPVPLPRPRPADSVAPMVAAGSTPPDFEESASLAESKAKSGETASPNAAPPADAASDAAPVPLPPPPAAENGAAPTPAPAPAPSASAPPSAPAGPQSTAPAEGESATPKPPRVYQTACPAVIGGLVTAKPLPPISDGQCGNPEPLEVTAVLVNGRPVPLTEPATVGCALASDLSPWLSDVDAYIWATRNTHITAVAIGGSYECRPRVTPDKSDTDLSEHGRADAVDVTGFTLADGTKLTVTADYSSADAKTSRLMHFAHDVACTRFATVLGPDANSLHHDHFHLDLGCHGAACTYRLCE